MKRNRICLCLAAVVLAAVAGYCCGKMCGRGRFVEYKVGEYDNVFPKNDILYNMETDLFLRISELAMQEKYDELNEFMAGQMAAARRKAAIRIQYVDKEQAAEIMRAMEMTERD